MPNSPVDVDPPATLNAYVESFSCHLGSFNMFAHEDQGACNSQSNSTPDNFALDPSATDGRFDLTYAPSTTSSSSIPAIALPAQEFSSLPTIQQTTHDFSLPVRGRYEPQIENRRVGNLSSGASRLPNPDSGAWYSQEGYQQAIAQFQARRSRSQPPRPGPGTGYLQQQPSQAPVTMRCVTCLVSGVSY